MKSDDTNQAVNASFPQIISEYEMYLCLNPSNLPLNEYPILEQDELPYDRVKKGEHLITKMFVEGYLSDADITQISLLAVRIGYLSMYSKSTSTLALLPSKDNYYELGEKEFKKLFEGMVNLTSLSNKPYQEALTKTLIKIASNPMYKGKTMTLEIRLINILILLLRLSNLTSVSFLAQLILQQYEMTK